MLFLCSFSRGRLLQLISVDFFEHFYMTNRHAFRGNYFLLLIKYLTSSLVLDITLGNILHDFVRF